MRSLVYAFLPITLIGLMENSPSVAWAAKAVGLTADPTQEATADSLSFTRDIRPIFQRHCLGCHQPAKQSGGYLMTEFASLLSGGSTGEPAIVPGDPDASYLLELIHAVDGVAEMPQNATPLAEADVVKIRRWIEEGAVNDLPSDSPLYTADRPPVYSRRPIITSLDVSPDGRFLAVNGIYETALLDLASGQLVRRLVGRSPRVESVAFSPDGARLAVAGGKPGEFGELQIWQAESGELLHSLAFTGDTLFGVSWSPDGKQIAFGATDNTVRAVDAQTGERVLFQNVAEDWIRDTVFSVDGAHLISVGRDMTCKLTEVATERFVDNITSITPGVLKGGISSVARHPTRDEIIVGTADGVPKLYRVFRETKRVIGDDANLLRQFPAMTGRVQAVDISRDGRRLAMTSGLDGKSEVRVYSYDFDTSVPADIKAINSKVGRSPEEAKRLQEFLTSDLVELARADIDQSALYALVFSSDGQHVFVAGGDGWVRELDAMSGSLLRQFSPFELDPSPSTGVAADSPKLPVLASDSEPTTSSSLGGAAVELQVFPSQLGFDSPLDYAQLIVQAVDADGTRHDVTASCRFETETGLITVNANAIAEPNGTGTGDLQVRYADLSTSVPVTANWDTLPPADFILDVNPLLGRLGCNAGTCHGSQNGKNGFKLSLRGYDPIFDVRALTDDLSARRVNVASPDDSLMLLKATGQVPHEGGALIERNDKAYTVLRRWIADGATLNRSAPKVASISIEPKLPVLAQPREIQQFRVVATYTDGQTRDVSREAFLETSDQEVALVTSAGQAVGKRRGETAILARYEGAFAATMLTVMGDRPGFAWSEPESYNEIDRLVARKWERMKILPSEICDDYTYLRRVYLDLTGLPPQPEAIREFIADSRPSREKRDAVVDQLIGTPEFVDHWTNKWADLLQVNEKFLARDGAARFHQWIREQVDANVPYDQFVRSIMTASGSTADHPAAAYFKILRTPEDVLENTTHLFLATRFNCNKCHDHPFERWTQDQYYETAAFFAQIDRARDPQSGDRNIGGSAVESATPLYELIQDSTMGEILHDRTKQVVAPAFPFEAGKASDPDAARRQQFATWMTSPDNPYFASSYANRLWGYLMGVGLIEPIDDIRASNPPSNPQLLEYLTRELVEHDFDARHLIRLICQSRTYQLSVATNPLNEDDTRNYSHALPRRLPAEVLFDTLFAVTGSQPRFPGEPPERRAAQLPDAGGKLPSGLLATLGKPVRESSCECERSNDLHLGSVLAMVSGPDQSRAIHDHQNAISALVREISDDRQLAREIYLRVLNRLPSDDEVAIALQVFSSIPSDHERLLLLLEQHVAKVGPEHAEREARRLQDLADAKAELERYIAETDPDLPAREAARLQHQTELKAALQKIETGLEEQLLNHRAVHLSRVQWHPVLASELVQSSGGAIEQLPDRSVLALENKGNTTTQVITYTDLSTVSAIRLEVLAANDLPGGGPGLAPNGNFVLHQFSLELETPDAPGKWQPVALTSPLADFAQSGFDVANLVDGDLQRTGWAVVPAVAKTHWATFQLQKPLTPAPGSRLRFSLVQNYRNDDQHQLGRFRIALSPATEPVGLSVSEEQLAVLIADPQTWSDEQKQRLLEDLRRGNPRRLQLERELAEAVKPLVIDEGIQTRRAHVAALSAVTPRDAEWLRLEQDARRSAEQLAEARLTAAQDLTWALINSPAFLFNH